MGERERFTPVEMVASEFKILTQDWQLLTFCLKGSVLAGTPSSCLFETWENIWTVRRARFPPENLLGKTSWHLIWSWEKASSFFFFSVHISSQNLFFQNRSYFKKNTQQQKKPHDLLLLANIFLHLAKYKCKVDGEVHFYKIKWVHGP